MSETGVGFHLVRVPLSFFFLSLSLSLSLLRSFYGIPEIPEDPFFNPAQSVSSCSQLQFLLFGCLTRKAHSSPGGS